MISVWMMAWIGLANASAVPTDPIEELFRRLNSGAALDPTSLVYSRMKARWDAGDEQGAAAIAAQGNLFYDVTVREFSSRMLTLDGDAFAPLNDFQTEVIGTIRDREDFRSVLTGNFRYLVDGTNPNPQFYRRDLSAYFDQLDKLGTHFQFSLKRTEPQWDDKDGSPSAGVLSSRGFGELYYSAGTNRRAVDASFRMFLCAPLAQWKDANYSDDRVRRDVDRLPGGNPTTYQNECRACHAPMDALAGAFARWDFNDGGALTFVGANGLDAKYNKNRGTYPEGYVTVDDSYINLLAAAPNDYFKWNGHTAGYGISDFGAMLADSGRFPECMAQRVFETVCKKPGATAGPKIKKWAKDLTDEKFDLMELFTEIAVDASCAN